MDSGIRATCEQYRIGQGDLLLGYCLGRRSELSFKIESKNLNLWYGEKQALKNINWVYLRTDYCAHLSIWLWQVNLHTVPKQDE